MRDKQNLKITRLLTFLVLPILVFRYEQKQVARNIDTNYNPQMATTYTFTTKFILIDNKSVYPMK